MLNTKKRNSAVSLLKVNETIGNNRHYILCAGNQSDYATASPWKMAPIQ